MNGDNDSSIDFVFVKLVSHDVCSDALINNIS